MEAPVALAMHAGGEGGRVREDQWARTNLLAASGERERAGEIRAMVSRGGGGAELDGELVPVGLGCLGHDEWLGELRGGVGKLVAGWDGPEIDWSDGAMAVQALAGAGREGAVVFWA